MCRKAIAWIETQLQAKNNQKQKDQVRELELLLIQKFPELVAGPFIDHPGYADHLPKCAANFSKYMKEKYPHDTDKTWLVGDSIAAQARDRLESVDPLLNNALGGMWAHHMLRMINDMAPLFMSAGFVPKNIVIGTPAGNNLLIRQEINVCIQQFMEVLNRLRQLYPASRIIVYGLPMVIVNYVILVRAAMDKAVIDWVQSDGNAVLLCLVKNFVKKNRILPKGDMSSDGVHMTPLGQLEFDADIQRGKKAAPGSLIP